MQNSSNVIKTPNHNPTNTDYPKKPIREFVGIFKNKTNVKLSIDEINEAIKIAGANAGMQGLK